jgi:hypothetical protein
MSGEGGASNSFDGFADDTDDGGSIQPVDGEFGQGGAGGISVQPVYGAPVPINTVPIDAEPDVEG